MSLSVLLEQVNPGKGVTVKRLASFLHCCADVSRLGYYTLNSKTG